jgi:hypothetical protein
VTHEAHVHDLDVDEPPRKKARFNFNEAKRRRTEDPIDLDSPGEAPTEVHDQDQSCQ